MEGDATAKVSPEVCSHAWPKRDRDKLSVVSDSHSKMRQVLEKARPEEVLEMVYFRDLT